MAQFFTRCRHIRHCDCCYKPQDDVKAHRNPVSDREVRAVGQAWYRVALSARPKLRSFTVSKHVGGYGQGEDQKEESVNHQSGTRCHPQELIVDQSVHLLVASSLSLSSLCFELILLAVLDCLSEDTRPEFPLISPIYTFATSV